MTYTHKCNTADCCMQFADVMYNNLSEPMDIAEKKTCNYNFVSLMLIKYIATYTAVSPPLVLLNSFILCVETSKISTGVQLCMYVLYIHTYTSYKSALASYILCSKLCSYIRSNICMYNYVSRSHYWN